MPYNDGTGPRSRGAGTGWGMGPCGAGLRRGRASGNRGFGYRQVNLTKDQELKILEEEERCLADELETVRKEKQNLKDRK